MSGTRQAAATSAAVAGRPTRPPGSGASPSGTATSTRVAGVADDETVGRASTTPSADGRDPVADRRRRSARPRRRRRPTSRAGSAPGATRWRATSAARTTSPAPMCWRATAPAGTSSRAEAGSIGAGSDRDRWSRRRGDRRARGRRGRRRRCGSAPRSAGVVDGGAGVGGHGAGGGGHDEDGRASRARDGGRGRGGCGPRRAWRVLPIDEGSGDVGDGDATAGRTVSVGRATTTCSSVDGRRARAGARTSTADGPA